MTDINSAPFRVFAGKILPEWLSAGAPHMNVAQYLKLFDDASTMLLESLGIGPTYFATTHHAYVAAEVHMTYQQEMHAGDMALVDITIADADAKRLHLALEMFREGDPARVCLGEMMFVSMDLTTRRSAPWAGNVTPRIEAARTLHAALPRPKGLGRSIGIKRA